MNLNHISYTIINLVIQTSDDQLIWARGPKNELSFMSSIGPNVKI